MFFQRKKENFFERKKSEKWSTIAFYEGESSVNGSGSVQRSPILGDENNGNYLIHHGGQILFEKYMCNYSGLERQLLIQILQGSVNIEQSKGICFNSIRMFIEQAVRILREQRIGVDKESVRENIYEE